MISPRLPSQWARGDRSHPGHQVSAQCPVRAMSNREISGRKAVGHSGQGAMMFTGQEREQHLKHL